MSNSVINVVGSSEVIKTADTPDGIGRIEPEHT